MHPTYAAYRAGSAVARALPVPLLNPAIAAAGTVARLTMRDRRTVVEGNLRRVIGPGIGKRELDHLVDDTFESYARYWAESFRLPGTPPEVLDAGIKREGLQHILDAIDAGNGIILAMPHLGSWEWSAFWLATKFGISITAVVEPVEPPELARWFTDLRSSVGINVVPLSPSAGSQIARALKANHLVCLFGDRDITGTGVEVTFFGERTTVPGGPATLALRSGAPLHTSAVYFEGDGHSGIVKPRLEAERRGKLRDDVARVTQDMITEFEELIRRAPEQWHLLQPNWPSDRPETDPGRTPLPVP